MNTSSHVFLPVLSFCPALLSLETVRSQAARVSFPSSELCPPFPASHHTHGLTLQSTATCTLGASYCQDEKADDSMS